MVPRTGAFTEAPAKKKSAIFSYDNINASSKEMVMRIGEMITN